MANQAQNSLWPLPKFYFKVTFGSGSTASFQEISGLDTETPPMDYRQNYEPQFSMSKKPGMAKFGSISLKKGVFVNDLHFWKWYDTIKTNVLQRESVKIELLDENGQPGMRWILTNAWPTKITLNDPEPDANELVIESLELAHESISMDMA